MNRPVTGLDDFPPDERPPANIVFQTYHIMVGIGFTLIVLSLVGFWAWKREWLYTNRKLLWLYVFAVLLSQIANQLGWFSAEIGRQPWIVYGLLKTRDALSRSISAEHVVTSLVMFGVVYLTAVRLVCLPAQRKDPARTGRGRLSRGDITKMNVAFDLNTIWFLLVGVLLTGYAILDGFDLGVGAIHLLAKSDEERRIYINAIGPVWDGNEVWLVTGGGALFAAFPEAYATAFSGFYLAMMLLLVG